MRVSVVCLPVIVLTLVVAWPSSTRSQAPTSPAPTSTRRELRVGAPGVPATLDPATAPEGTVPLIARQAFDTLVVYREVTTDVDPVLATRSHVPPDGLTWLLTMRGCVRFHYASPICEAY